MESIRSDFPILASHWQRHTMVYLDSASSAQKPRVVIDALSECYETYYANAIAVSTSSA
ncbi:MAG: hypothetical protein CM1200mP2_50350 [Planctomycetaceae bacterium]|nr:MAG: hypothetical protein CM1200mP2_50350 [Planctomycetaceae bacterium]